MTTEIYKVAAEILAGREKDFMTSVNFDAFAMADKRRSLYNVVRRTIDIIAVVVTAPAALIVLGFAALAIYVSMGRPIFFTQERVGLNGTIFKMFKLRSMRPTDHKIKTSKATIHNDPRVTPLGRYLRRSHIDELPQLWNILRGDMTLIGPRPEQVHLVELYRKAIPYFDCRHMVKPGLSGWAQVRFGYATDTKDTRAKVHYDLFYLMNYGPMLDFRILVHTIKAFFDPNLFH